jgi:HlyD family secretion protein
MKIRRQSVACSRMAVALIIVPLVALGSWHFWHQDSAAPDVAIVPAQLGDLLSAVTATGTVQARRTVDIKYDTQSLIVGLFAKEGDRVAANQPVATMDLSLLEPTLVQARQALQKDQANLQLAQASLKRSDALAAAQVLAQADLDTSRANYEALLHQTQADEGAIAEQDEQIRRAKLRSPINGVVIALYVHVGEMLGSATAVAGLGPNSAVSKPTNTLMTIAEEGDLEVDADVNAVDLGGVYVGQSAKFTIDAFQPQIFQGVVRTIALQPTVTSGVTTYRVVIALHPSDPRFRIGLPANIMLFRELAKNTVLVPPTALRKDQNGAQLSVLVSHSSNSDTREGSLQENPPSEQFSIERRRVSVVAETPSAVAVLGDVHAGDKIVVDSDSSRVDGRLYRLNLLTKPFKPNPDLSDLQFERSADAAGHSVPAIPGPKPKGFLQRLFNP